MILTMGNDRHVTDVGRFVHKGTDLVNREAVENNILASGFEHGAWAHFNCNASRISIVDDLKKFLVGSVMLILT